MQVVLLTHVFPRAANDSLGAFLLHLVQGFGGRANVLVVAPHAAGLSEQDRIESISVTRFRYASDANETLAYTGIMHEQVARGIGGKILFARLLFAYFRSARKAVRSHKAEVIHAHWWLPGGFVGALVSKWTRVPLVITTHGTDVEQLVRAHGPNRSRVLLFRRRVSSPAARIICASNYWSWAWRMKNACG